MTDQIKSEEKQPKTRRSSWASTGILLSTCGMVIFVCAFGYGYFQLSQVNIQLAEMVADVQNHTADNVAQFTTLQKTVTDLQQHTQKSQDLSAQQEQLMADWHAAQQGDLNKWHLAEAQYLVKLADDNLHFGHNTPLVITLLQQADKVLQNSQDSAVIEIRKSLATDLAAVKAAPTVDLTDVYLRLSAVNNQINQLPLPSNPLSADANQKTAAVMPANQPWWKAGINYSMQVLSKIVIVRNNGTNALPLVMPEEKAFLYQNLHAQMESAMWSVQQRNQVLYAASLERATAWIHTYFVQESSVTKTLLQTLDELKKVDLQTPMINLSNTLQLFDNSVAVASEAKNAGKEEAGTAVVAAPAQTLAPTATETTAGATGTVDSAANAAASGSH